MRTEQYVRTSNSGELTLSVKANGGSVAVEKQVGTDWIVADTFSTDGSWRLALGASATRFTPTGGAAYEVGK